MLAAGREQCGGGKDGESVASLGLTGEEEYAVEGLGDAIRTGFKSGRDLTVKAKGADGAKVFRATARIDTPQEVLYYQHGGILQYVLRQLVRK